MAYHEVAVPLDRKSGNNIFSGIVVCVQVFVFLGYFLVAETKPHLGPLAGQEIYNYYTNVTLVVLVGFGCLRLSVRHHGLVALGFTLLITCLGLEVSVLLEPLFMNGFQMIDVNMLTLMRGNLAVAAMLVSFGGVVGRVNPAQVVVLVLFESVAYCANKVFLLTKLFGVADEGSTITVHMFGAYFGLAVSCMLGKPSLTRSIPTSTTPDILSMLGTVILWIYWPSFVSGALPTGTPQAQFALANTVLALLASTIATFAVSPLFSGHLIRAVDVQNAALAGGVCIGSIADLDISPIMALVVGSVAGCLSTVGFCKVQSILQEYGVHDSCGIHNLHGMPSIVGGLWSAAVFSAKNDPAAGTPGAQLFGVLVTLLVAIGSGVLAGLVMKVLKDDSSSFDDTQYWDFTKCAQ